MSIGLTTVILFAVFGILLFLSCPISVSIVIASIVTAVSSLSWDQITFITMQKMNSGVESFSLLAIPLFILAGNIMNQGGIAKRLVDFGMQHYWQSHHPWIVPEPFTLEPTESFSKDDLDEFAAILKEISRECYEEPETIRSAPHNAPIHNTLLDEVMDFDKIAVTYRQLRKRMEAGTISKDILGQ